jgi:hypothetical protein
MPVPPAEIEDVIFETSSDHEMENPPPLEPQLKPAPQREPQRKRKKEPKSDPKNRNKTSASRRRGVAASQLSPPPTLASSRNASKNSIASKGDGFEAVVNDTSNGATQVIEVPRSSGTRKALVTKRKPKRPLVSSSRNHLKSLESHA